MEYKPTITYSFSEAGDENLFLTLSTHLRKILQNHPVKWKRSYGRTPHKLALDVKFLPLTTALLRRNDLVTRPYFHVFWTDCNDMDFYRSSVKSEIASWLSELLGNDTSDWIIVVVTGDGTSRSNKPKLALPRTSLADKIKTDFCSKSPERIHVLQDPMRDSSKTNDSWSSLAVKLAGLTVLCLEEAVTKYEDRVRAERERRNEKSWNFCSYFIMQEELAFMFEMLSLHEESLIQYNELDAMFTQYLLNAHAGDVAHWLSSFTKPITRWRSLTLWRRIDGEARQMLIEDTASLIDVRNYLFARHCHLLFAIRDMKRVTELMHTFLHSTTLELDILEVEMPPGAKDCWVFMSCMELAQSLEKTRKHFSQTSQINVGDETPEVFMKITNNELRLQVANLWNLARSKLYNLGELCGLMPDAKTSSENLQTVVELISGMGEEEERDGLVRPPSLILREALSSKEKFGNQYHELSVLAMGTFKHTERYRSARSIGKDLAEFYMRSDEPGKAESLFLDCVRMYTNEAWPLLAAGASEKLAECYKQLCNVRRYLRLCCALMCSNYISKERKSFYCEEIHSLSTDFGDHSLPILLAVFANVTSVQFVPARTSSRHKSTQHILLHIHSKAPKTMHFHSLQLSLRHHEPNTDDILDKSTHSDFLDEELEIDVLSYATFSSDEETDYETESSKANKLAASASKQSLKNQIRRKRRFVSTSSFDSIYGIKQKTPLGPDGTIQLISMEEPFTEPSKCVANRLPPVIHIAYESEEKDGEVVWAGLTCRSARQLLRRQDSSQSLCSIHSSTTNIVMEAYNDNLEVKKVSLKPGDNVIKVPVETSKAGDYTLRQLRFSINKLHFVLPRILPVITYTITRDKPTMSLDHEPRLYCNIEQNIYIRLMSGDYEVEGSSGDRTLVMNLPKYLKICKVESLSVKTEEGTETDHSPPSAEIEEMKCSIILPPSPVRSVIIIKVSCICTQPVAHDLGHKFHRRTHSAPPTTVHKHTQVTLSEFTNSNHAVAGTKGLDKFKSATPLAQRTNRIAESPVKKFLTFVREVADRVDAKTSKTDEKEDIYASPDPIIVTKDDFLEVTLEGPSVDKPEKIHNHINHIEYDRSSLSSAAESNDDNETISVSSVSSIKKSSSMSEKHGVSRSGAVQRRHGHTLTVHEECVLDDDSTIFCNISFSLPWSEVPAISTSLSFEKLLDFSHKLLKSHSCKVPDSTCLHQIVSITVSNSCPRTFFLKNYCLRFTSKVKVTDFVQEKMKKIQPSQSITFAWRAEFTSSSPPECSAQFNVDVLNNDSESSTVAPACYKFEVENIQTLYTVTTAVGESNEELISGQMTTLTITVKRLRNDPEHEHTRSGQQLFMYQVVDTRGRWAVCGKSTGIISLSLSMEEPEGCFATATLEVMPLVDGLLHRPNVVLQRYLKRRSSEFDEQLSSTESPVLKPPRLMDFRHGEVVNLDEYKQVKVLATPTMKAAKDNDIIETLKDVNLLKKTKL